MLSVDCRLLRVCFALWVVGCVWFDVRRLLFGVWRLLLGVRCVPLVVCRWLFDVCLCSLFVVL